MKAMRLTGLMRKEVYEILRDPSSIAIAFVLPLVLLLIFGYGVSLDARQISIAVVVDNPTQLTASFLAELQRSPWFRPATYPNEARAEQALMDGRANAIVWLRSDFTRLSYSSGSAPIHLTVNGVDANQARIIENYVNGAWLVWLQQEATRQGAHLAAPVVADARVWFNPALRSRDYLIPGLIAIIMTLIGALLTALVVAREWERGTMEGIMVTPVAKTEILLGKLIPYFVMGMGGMIMSTAMAVFLFGVPLRGSLLVLFGTALFLLTALGMGLVISVLARSQFVAAMVAIVTTFLPAFILSGFLFDIRSMPGIIQVLTHIIAARYFVTLLQTLFLAGDIWPVILRNVWHGHPVCLFSRHRTAAFSQEVGLMRLVLQRVIALAIKELLSLLRDPASRAVLIGPPIIQLVVFGYAATFDLKHVPFVVYNQDQGRLSRDFIARFAGSPSFDLVRIVHSQDALAQAIDESRR